MYLQKHQATVKSKPWQLKLEKQAWSDPRLKNRKVFVSSYSKGYYCENYHQIYSAEV